MTQQKLTDAIASTDKETQIWKSRFNLAKSTFEMGKYKEAESLLYKALEQGHKLKEREFATNTCLVGLGVVYFVLGKKDEAEKQLQEAKRALSGVAAPALKELYGVALRIHAEVLSDKGELKAAASELEEAADVLESLGIDGAVQLSYALSDLAMLHIKGGDLAEAKELICTAMDLLRGAVNADNAEYLRANMIYNICQTPDQEELLTQVENSIVKMEYQLGQKHPNVIRAVGWYLEKLHEAGDTEQIREAEEKFGIQTKE